MVGLAVMAGAPAEPRIVPFRGAYLKLRPERSELVRASVYPVPDPDLPFLGGHLTRTIDGEVLLGPSALMVAARDAYRVGKLRPRDLGFKPAMLPMMACFALMNATFVSALALGTAANAILLQYTAPMWMFLASVWWLGEKADYRSLATVLIGLAGIAVIVLGGWHGGELSVIGLGLVSGLTYGGVVICLRVLRTSSAIWLTVLNHLFSALVLVPFIYHLDLPTGPQLLWLFAYGAGQMAVPYWLMARGVRSVSAQEAGAITLLEPLLNPVWAFLISGERPTEFTLVGGAFILSALVYRYWPGSRRPASTPS